jgi:hypothetical protein
MTDPDKPTKTGPSFTKHDVDEYRRERAADADKLSIRMLADYNAIAKGHSTLLSNVEDYLDAKAVVKASHENQLKSSDDQQNIGAKVTNSPRPR